MIRLLFGTLILTACGFGDDGSIRGVVVDRSGSVIPNTSVTITGTTKAVSDSRGRFILSGLQPRTYALTFDAPGFKIVTREAVPVTTSSSNSYPIFILDVDLSRAICVFEITGKVPSAAAQKKARP